MKKILTGRATISTSKRQIKSDWRKKMSDHVAWALIVYTGLHIFLTLGAISQWRSVFGPLCFSFFGGCNYSFLSQVREALA